MTRNMFRDVIDPSTTVSGKRGYTVPLSIIAHTLILAALIIIPLLATDSLPVPPTLLVSCHRQQRRRAPDRPHRTRRPSIPIERRSRLPTTSLPSASSSLHGNWLAQSKTVRGRSQVA
jgi:hypothetical protein